MRRFKVYRTTPPAEYINKGLANAGITPDMEGCEFSDGTVAVRWCTEYRSMVWWPDFQTFYNVHIGPHQEYGQTVHWIDGE